MEKSSQDKDKSDSKEDEDEIFSRYIASELRSMDTNMKRLVKWRIQSVTFNAHSGSWQSQQPAPNLMYPPYGHQQNLMQRVSTSPASFSSDSPGQYPPQNMEYHVDP